MKGGMDIKKTCMEYNIIFIKHKNTLSLEITVYLKRCGNIYTFKNYLS